MAIYQSTHTGKELDDAIEAVAGKSTVSVEQTKTSGDEIAKITIDGEEKVLYSDKVNNSRVIFTQAGASRDSITLNADGTQTINLTDQFVIQVPKTDADADLPLFFSTTAGRTGQVQDVVAYDVDLYYNPSTQTLTSKYLNGTAKKAVQDVAGNEIANYYATKSEVSAIPKFAIQVVESLPTTGISTTTVYLLKTSETETGNLYTEYIYVNNAWEELGTQEVAFPSGSTTDYGTIAVADGAVQLTSVLKADKATSDESGNTISTTYAKKSELPIDYFNRGTALTSGQDLNDITQFGVYYTKNATVTESLLNIPCSRLHANARLEVYPSVGIDSSEDYLFQKLTLNSVGCLYEFIRAKSTAWSPWHLNNGNDFTKVFNDTTTETYYKVASYTASSSSYTDYDMTFLVTNTYNTNQATGILKCHLRRNSTSSRYISAKWLVASEGIEIDNWFVAYDEANKTFDLWCKIDTQYHGYVVTLMESSNRHQSVDSANYVTMYFLGQDNIDTDYTSHTYDATATSTVMTLLTNS